MDDWRERAACRSADTNLFFDDGDNNKTVSAANQARRHQALAFCQVCPVVDQCLKEHLAETIGIWGGTTPEDRSRLRASPTREHPRDRLLRMGPLIHELRGQGLTWADTAAELKIHRSWAVRLYRDWKKEPEAQEIMAREEVMEQVRKAEVAVALLKNGLPATKAAAATGLSRWQVETLARKNGVQLKPGNLTDKQVAAIEKMAAEGMPVATIARKLKFSDKTVYNVVRKWKDRAQAGTRTLDQERDAWVRYGSARLPARYLGESDEAVPMYFMKIQLAPAKETRKWLRPDEVEFIRPVRPIKRVRARAERSVRAATQTRTRSTKAVPGAGPGERAGGANTGGGAGAPVVQLHEHRPGLRQAAGAVEDHGGPEAASPLAGCG